MLLLIFPLNCVFVVNDFSEMQDQKVLDFGKAGTTE
jgi:hypothetical protein